MFLKKIFKFIKCKNCILNRLICIFKMTSFKQKIFSYLLENMFITNFQNKLQDIDNKLITIKNLLDILMNLLILFINKVNLQWHIHRLPKIY